MRLLSPNDHKVAQRNIIPWRMRRTCSLFVWLGWFVKKYCWLVCVREKYCSGWKFTIVYDRFTPAEQADGLLWWCVQNYAKLKIRTDSWKILVDSWIASKSIKTWHWKLEELSKIFPRRHMLSYRAPLDIYCPYWDKCMAGDRLSPAAVHMQRCITDRVGQNTRGSSTRSTRGRFSSTRLGLL